MRIALVTVVASCVGVTTMTAGLAAEPFELKGTWWQEAAMQTRHTTLVCSFDNAGHNDADYARDFALSGGFGMTM